MMKWQTNSFLYCLFSGLCAGVMIGIGGAVYLACESRVVGAFLFATGLFTICIYGWKLFTGAIGYLLTDGTRPWGARLAEAAAIWLGNLGGTWLAAQTLLLVRDDLRQKAASIASTKLAQPLATAFVLAVFCGLLMFLAVDVYRTQQGVQRLLGIFLAVPLFILAGFEHSIANMFYLKLGQGLVLGPDPLLLLAVVTVGNGLGAFLFAQGKKIALSAKS